MSHIKDRLKQYKDEYSKYGKYDGLYVADVLEMLEQLRSGLEQDEKENGWIPVSERLPKFKKSAMLGSLDCYETEKVFVQTKRGEMFVAWCHKTVYASKKFNDEYLWYTQGTDGRKMRVMSKVVAWRPLPEPYKED
nr:MAG TPA: Protein of unknown function (DUF551) [Bacteriophage sp.]